MCDPRGFAVGMLLRAALLLELGARFGDEASGRILDAGAGHKP